MEDLEVTESAFVHDLRPLQVYSKEAQHALVSIHNLGWAAHEWQTMSQHTVCVHETEQLAGRIESIICTI